MAIVYQHIRKDTDEVFYVGIGDFEKRAYAKSKADRVNKHWFGIVNKYGYEVEIVLKDVSWAEACYTERYLIRYYGRRNLGTGPLVNLTDGGDGVKGMRHTEKTKELIKSQTSTPERRAISRENIKKSFNPESRAKALKNRNYTIIGDKQKIVVHQYSLSGEFIKEWKSAKDAARELNLNYGGVNNNLRNKTKSAGGFIWKYYNVSFSMPVYKKFVMTDKQKKAIYEKNRTPIVQFSLKGELINEWASVTEASENIGIGRATLSNHITGHAKTCAGYIWKYKNN